MDAATLLYTDASVPPILWVIFVILLLLSAFFSASETAYSSLSIVRITNYAENGKKSAARACGIRTGDLRHRSRKKSRFFQKSGANLHPCLAITPIEGSGCRLFFIFFEKMSVFL